MALAVAPRAGRAQSDLHPRWEIAGFDFAPDGVWRVRARRVAQARTALLSQRAFNRLNAALAPSAQGAPAPSLAPPAVTGVLQVPVILMRFQDTPAAFVAASYDTVLFDSTPPYGRPYTIRTFYEELSHHLFSMRGQVLNWTLLSKPEASYTGGTNCTGNPWGTTNCNGIFQSNTPGMSPIDSLQTGLREALRILDSLGVNWSQFDADSDGYVDMAVFVHPNVDGACGNGHTLGNNNNIWSHRYVLFPTYSTRTPWPGHSGQTIQVRDYTIQSGVGGAAACDSTQIMPIGTAGHESGHGLDLPDLYDIRFASEGIGEWGLMGSGNYSSPFSPSRMEAWSLSQLGWVTVVPITRSGTYTIGPAASADSAYYVRVQGANPRGEYFLLENREAVLADTALIRLHCARSGNPPGCGGGLLVWHVDSEQVANNGFHVSNLVNYGAIHGVELMQADGLRNLDRNPSTDLLANRGDAGDPYPGVTGNTSFGWNTTPAATKNVDQSFIGFAIDSIQLGMSRIAQFRLRFGVALTYQATPGGTVQANPAADTSGSFLAQGSSVTLTATPNAGARFLAWSGDTTATSTTLTLPMGHSYAVTANFLRPLKTTDVVAQLLTGSSPLLATDLNALDLLGNHNGRFDVGDFLAWVQATGAPLTARQGALAAALTAQGRRP